MLRQRSACGGRRYQEAVYLQQKYGSINKVGECPIFATVLSLLRVGIRATREPLSFTLIPTRSIGLSRANKFPCTKYRNYAITTSCVVRET
jgi:hypothetical protein